MRITIFLILMALSIFARAEENQPLPEVAEHATQAHDHVWHGTEEKKSAQTVTPKKLDLSSLYGWHGKEYRSLSSLLQGIPYGATEIRRNRFELETSRLFSCENETLSLNVWGISDHHSKSRPKSLNERNKGFGIFYTCGNLSFGLDHMVNSNYGKAKLLSMFWGVNLLEIGPLRVHGKLGYGRVSYEVPRYNATIYDNSALAFIGFGLKQLPGLSINIAPVPKTAGNANIYWLTYELYRFK